MSDLTIFGKTFTNVAGIKATDTDGNEVVYGGGGNAVSGSFTLDSNFALDTTPEAFTPIKLPFKPDFFWMALSRESYDAEALSSNKIRMLFIIGKTMSLPMRQGTNISTDSFPNDSYPVFQANTVASTDVESNGTAGNGFSFYAPSISGRTYFDTDGQLYVGKYSSVSSHIQKGTWHYVAMKAE